MGRTVLPAVVQSQGSPPFVWGEGWDGLGRDEEEGRHAWPWKGTCAKPSLPVHISRRVSATAPLGYPGTRRKSPWLHPWALSSQHAAQSCGMEPRGRWSWSFFTHPHQDGGLCVPSPQSAWLWLYLDQSRQKWQVMMPTSGPRHYEVAVLFLLMGPLKGP